MYFKILVSFTLIFFGYEAGKRVGYLDGKESIEFDRQYAARKLDQCMRIVTSK